MPLIPVDRIDDPRLAAYRDVRDKDLRGRDDHFMAESEMVVRRLLATPERLESVFLSTARAAGMRDVIEAAGPEVPVYVADLDLMTRIAGFHIHRGALAVGRRPARRDLAPEHVLASLGERPRLTVLIAEGLTNVDNIGALFRNAAGFGCDAVVLDPTCCDPLYRKAIRVSMGHVLSIPWAVCRSWPDDLAALRDRLQLTLVAAETGPQAQPAWELPAVDRVGIVFGSEAHGVTPATLALCDHVLEIPMTPAVPSLNVAVASSIFLYERNRDGAGS